MDDRLVRGFLIGERRGHFGGGRLRRRHERGRERLHRVGHDRAAGARGRRHLNRLFHGCFTRGDGRGRLLVLARRLGGRILRSVLGGGRGGGFLTVRRGLCGLVRVAVGRRVVGGRRILDSFGALRGRVVLGLGIGLGIGLGGGELRASRGVVGVGRVLRIRGCGRVGRPVGRLALLGGSHVGG